MAHQDLKPSNVLVFQQSRTSKICDLETWSADMSPLTTANFSWEILAMYHPR